MSQVNIHIKGCGCKQCQIRQKTSPTDWLSKVEQGLLASGYVLSSILIIFSLMVLLGVANGPKNSSSVSTVRTEMNLSQVWLDTVTFVESAGDQVRQGLDTVKVAYIVGAQDLMSNTGNGLAKVQEILTAPAPYAMARTN